MFSSNRARVRWFLIALTSLTLPIQNSHSAGMVSFTFESGLARTPYTYVFSGRVTCQNKPCANAVVNLDLQTTTRGAIAKTTRTDDSGNYQLAVTVPGAPEDSSIWSIHAHSASIAEPETAQAEGRIILMDGEPTVVVDRSLLLIQA